MKNVSACSFEATHLDGWMNLPTNVSYLMSWSENCSPEICERCFISFSCLLLQPVCPFQTEAQDWIVTQLQVSSPNFIFLVPACSRDYPQVVFIEFRDYLSMCCFNLNPAVHQIHSVWTETSKPLTFTLPPNICRNEIWCVCWDLYFLCMRIKSDFSDISQCLL